MIKFIKNGINELQIIGAFILIGMFFIFIFTVWSIGSLLKLLTGDKK